MAKSGKKAGECVAFMTIGVPLNSAAIETHGPPSNIETIFRPPKRGPGRPPKWEAERAFVRLVEERAAALRAQGRHGKAVDNAIIAIQEADPHHFGKMTFGALRRAYYRYRQGQ
jgi:hypothetical protein